MSKKTVAIIDYGMGNLHSIAKALKYVANNNTHVVVTSDKKQIQQADRIVVPGVGAIRDCMAQIESQGVDEIVYQTIEKGEQPILGICIGMQIMLQSSEENQGVKGLGILPGKVRSFRQALAKTELKVPHMGWNQVHFCQDHPICQNLDKDPYFYFVHSFYANCENVENLLASSCYGVSFASALTYKNLVALQFHPEKSADNGLKLLANFLNWQIK